MLSEAAKSCMRRYAASEKGRSTRKNYVANPHMKYACKVYEYQVKLRQIIKKMLDGTYSVYKRGPPRKTPQTLAGCNLLDDKLTELAHRFTSISQGHEKIEDILKGRTLNEIIKELRYEAVCGFVPSGSHATGIAHREETGAPATNADSSSSATGLSEPEH